MIRQRQEVQRLDFFEEGIGTLLELSRDEGCLVARISKVILVLPARLDEKLRPLLGLRVGILHTNISGKEYLVRIITERGKKTVLMTDGSREIAQRST